MTAFDPYITFRLILSLLFSAFILYDLIGFFVWYRQLPPLVQRITLLKLLQLRSRALKIELSLIIILTSLEGWLMFLLIKGT